MNGRRAKQSISTAVVMCH